MEEIRCANYGRRFMLMQETNNSLKMIKENDVMENGVKASSHKMRMCLKNQKL